MSDDRRKAKGFRKEGQASLPPPFAKPKPREAPSKPQMKDLGAIPKRVTKDDVSSRGRAETKPGQSGDTRSKPVRSRSSSHHGGKKPKPTDEQKFAYLRRELEATQRQLQQVISNQVCAQGQTFSRQPQFDKATGSYAMAPVSYSNVLSGELPQSQKSTPTSDPPSVHSQSSSRSKSRSKSKSRQKVDSRAKVESEKPKASKTSASSSKKPEAKTCAESKSQSTNQSSEEASLPIKNVKVDKVTWGCLKSYRKVFWAVTDSKLRPDPESFACDFGIKTFENAWEFSMLAERAISLFYYVTVTGARYLAMSTLEGKVLLYTSSGRDKPFLISDQIMQHLKDPTVIKLISEGKGSTGSLANSELKDVLRGVLDLDNLPRKSVEGGTFYASAARELESQTFGPVIRVSESTLLKVVSIGNQEKNFFIQRARSIIGSFYLWLAKYFSDLVDSKSDYACLARLLFAEFGHDVLSKPKIGRVKPRTPMEMVACYKSDTVMAPFNLCFKETVIPPEADKLVKVPQSSFNLARENHYFERFCGKCATPLIGEHICAVKEEVKCAYPLCTEPQGDHVVSCCPTLSYLCEECGLRGHKSMHHVKEPTTILIVTFLKWFRSNLITGFTSLVEHPNYNHLVKGKNWRTLLFGQTLAQFPDQENLFNFKKAPKSTPPHPKKPATEDLQTLAEQMAAGLESSMDDIRIFEILDKHVHFDNRESFDPEKVFEIVKLALLSRYKILDAALCVSDLVSDSIDAEAARSLATPLKPEEVYINLPSPDASDDEMEVEDESKSQSVFTREEEEELLRFTDEEGDLSLKAKNMSLHKSDIESPVASASHSTPVISNVTVESEPSKSKSEPAVGLDSDDDDEEMA